MKFGCLYFARLLCISGFNSSCYPEDYCGHRYIADEGAIPIDDNPIIDASPYILKNIPSGCVVVGSRPRIIERLNDASGEWESVDEVL